MIKFLPQSLVFSSGPHLNRAGSGLTLSACVFVRKQPPRRRFFLVSINAGRHNGRCVAGGPWRVSRSSAPSKSRSGILGMRSVLVSSLSALRFYRIAQAETAGFGAKQAGRYYIASISVRMINEEEGR